MALVFPSNPNLGQEYMGFSWDGEKWVCSVSAEYGIPDAPADNYHYTRFNNTWQRYSYLLQLNWPNVPSSVGTQIQVAVLPGNTEISARVRSTTVGISPSPGSSSFDLLAGTRLIGTFNVGNPYVSNFVTMANYYGGGQINSTTNAPTPIYLRTVTQYAAGANLFVNLTIRQIGNNWYEG